MITEAKQLFVGQKNPKRRKENKEAIANSTA